LHGHADMRMSSVSGAFLLLCCILLAEGGFSQSIEGLVHVQLQADVRVFAVMSALNVGGFDLDAEDLADNPTRQLVRQRMMNVDADLRGRLKEFCRSVETDSKKGQEQGRFVSYALLLQGPPRFSLTLPSALVPAEVQSLEGFEQLVAELWEKQKLAALWGEVRAAYLGEIEAYRPFLRGMIVETLHYLHTEARVALDRRMILVPDLLNGYGIVNARNIENDYIVVVGPSRANRRPLGAIRHEYLHFLVDPLLTKYRARLPDPEPFLLRARSQPRALPAYGVNFPMMVGESLIRVLEPLLDGAHGSKAEAEMVDLYDRGLILAPYFVEAFKGFAGEQASLQEFFPGMIAGIRWESEQKRDEVIEGIRQAIAGQKAAAAQTSEDRERLRKDLNDLLIRANQLLQDRQFASAKEALEKALAIDGQNAGALFGLAQVASHEQDLDGALQHYGQAVAHAGAEVWIVAWSLLHRGNIYSFQGDRARAEQEWAKVLKLEGNLRGADIAARKALGK
jgi:tetratricopeptide (TPR) repeat protein